MIAVIGDIHGCYLTLVELYAQILKKYPDIEIYSVGDLIDRGNKSFEVMEFVLALRTSVRPNCQIMIRSVCGNVAAD